MYVVILAGGGGTRLWPLSTPDRPKPFIPLLSDRTLFQRTVDRLLDGRELGITPRDIIVVADRRHGGLVRAQAPAVGVVEEPMGRNTAAAIALATVAIERPDDEVMVVLPADHTIVDEPVFRGVIRDAAEGVAHGAFGIESPLVTLGIEVARPATEYGYLRPTPEFLPADRDDTLVHGLRVYPLEAFEEKPDAARAGQLQASAGVAWNAGMFLWRRRAIRQALAAFAPDILDAVAAAHRDGTLPQAYPSIRSTSIDYAVMEKAAAAGLVVMGAMDVGWSDLGGWTALLAALGSRATGRVVQAGEPAEVTADDLVVRRRDGRLVVDPGPSRGILDASGPSALLAGARADRPIVDALVERVDQQEARS